MFRLGVQAMPHFGLMNERELGPVAGPLQRARLHLRGGKRRLRQGKVSAGIVTLYDALEGAMLSYAESPDTGPGLQFLPGERRYDSKVLYAVLVRSGVLDGSFDFEAFDQLTEQALNQELVDYDTRDLLSGVESVMTQLGVLPFDETGLPPEDPSTF
jgi:hypothetical protein